MDVMNIAVIGAGAISKRHLTALKGIPGAKVVTVCDLNLDQAKALATEFGVATYCGDSTEVLKDPTVDAVIIATPTFTHGKLVVDALNHGKHVMCEKPPALTYQEALANEEAAQKAGKVLMYGFVCRFDTINGFLKKYIDDGRMGEIYYAEASRMEKCAKINGWFRDKSKSGGGSLMDAAIHQLDLLLYFMGYPKVKSVKGFTSDVNKDLPERMKGLKTGYMGVGSDQVERTIESFATGYIVLEGGKNISIKAAQIANAPTSGTRFELLGDKGGVTFEGGELKMLTVDESDYFMVSRPIIKDGGPDFKAELQHFVDCCNGEAECISNAHQGSEIMKILNAIYESAETGKEIVFE